MRRIQLCGLSCLNALETLVTQYSNPSQATITEPSSSTGPAAKLKLRSWSAFGLVAGLLVCHQLLLQPVLLRLDTDGPVINVAGRQRMLSQKLSKAALALQAAIQPEERNKRREELAAVAAEWSRAHRGLQQGDPGLKLPRATDPKVRAAYRELEPHVQAILGATEDLLARDPLQSEMSISQASAIRAIMQHEEVFLTLMHRVVGLHEANARAHVFQLQVLGWGIVATILALLLTIQFFVIRPAVDVVGNRLALWEAQYRRLVESMSEGLVVLDAQGNIQLANRRFCELLELPLEEVLGRPASQFVTDSDSARYDELIANAFQRTAPAELVLQQSTGRLIETMASIQSIPDGGGSREVYLLVVTDITERKQAEKKSRELLEQLAHANRLKSIGELTAELAHELNQPLAAIANFAEACLATLREGTFAVEELRTPLQRILAAALRSGEIVRRGRRYSQRKPHEVHPESLNELVREVEQLCRDEGLRREVTIELELAPDLPLIPVDGIQVQQVLANLIQNAFSAMESTPVSRRRLRIITQNEAPGSVCVSVCDCGTGLKGIDVSRLFEPFYTTRAGGLGLGLAIAQNIVEAHGGSINATNNAEGGATFRFTLPTRAPVIDSGWSNIEDEVTHA